MKPSEKKQEQFYAFILKQGGTVQGMYKNSQTKVSCVCSKGHNCQPVPRNVINGSNMCKKCATLDRKRTNRRPVREREQLFIDEVTKRGGILIEAYNGDKTKCECPNHHECFPILSNLERGLGMCARCARSTSEECAVKFKTRIENDLGGKVMGEYKGSNIPISCLCNKGHECNPTPNNAYKGGICKICADVSSTVAKQRFETNITNLGGVVIGNYVNAHTRVLCLCKNGHLCSSDPTSISQGIGMCYQCVRNTPEMLARMFESEIIKLGGYLVESYINYNSRVKAVCINGHECYVLPSSIFRGNGMCRKCSGRCPMEAEIQFHKNVQLQGGKVLGKYINYSVSVECMCKNGHNCQTLPQTIRYGGSMCWECVGNASQFGEEKLNMQLKKYHFKLIGNYINNRTRVFVECEKSHKFWKSPGQLMRVCLCPICHPKSMGEHRLLKSFNILQIVYVREFRVEGLKRFDFCLQNEDILVEFDGEQHFMQCCWSPTELDVKISQENDIFKTRMANENGYRILRIDYSFNRLNDMDFHAEIIKAIQLFTHNPRINVIVSSPDKYIWLTKEFNLIFNDGLFGAFQ